MIARLRFEFIKLCSIIIFPFLLAIFFLSLLVVNSGIKEYQEKYRELETNSKIENGIVEMQIRYEQYGIYGHRIFTMSSPLIIYFFNSSLFENLESNISTSEIIEIYSNIKGDKVFKKEDLEFGDFGSILNIFGSLLMVTLGVIAIKNRKLLFKGEKRVFLQILLRLFLLDAYWLFLLAGMYLFALFRGISFSPVDFHYYIIFSIVSLLFLNLWFLTGMFLSFLINYKRALLTSIIIWASILIFIPGVRFLVISHKQIKSEEVNLIKVNKMMKIDKKIMSIVMPLLEDKDKNYNKIKSIMRTGAESYVANENVDNKQLELELQKSIKVQSDIMEDFSCYLPWSFYLQVQESLSSKGYEAYDGFVNYAIEQRDGFFRYIIDKRYNSNDKKIIPYFKKGENMYHSQSTLPRKFWLGISSTIFFSLLFITLSFLVYRRRLKKENKQDEQEVELRQFNQAKSFFHHCKDKEEMEKLTRYFTNHEETNIIEKIDLHTYDPGICLKHWLKFICAVNKFKEEDVLKLIYRLDVDKKALKLSPGKIDNESFKKVYLALKLCEKKKYNILVDFFRGETEEFEVSCKMLMQEISLRFIYLSSDRLKQSESGQLGSACFLTVDWLNKDMYVR